MSDGECDDLPGMPEETVRQRRVRLRDVVTFASARSGGAPPVAAYSVAEAPIVGAYAELCGYSNIREGAAASIDVPRAEVPSGERTLPTPVVETVDVQRVRDALAACPNLSQLERFAVETMDLFLDVAKYKAAVLGPDFISDTSAVCHRVKVPRRRVIELKVKGYLKRLRGHIAMIVTCPLFFVPKDGLEDRTIWNGKRYNSKCIRPWRCPFERMHVMFRELTQPEGKWFLGYDFRTWFVQLLVHPWIHRTFGVRMADGSLWRLCGVPMGFAWAPVLAQCVALALMALVLRVLPPDVRRHVCVAYVYIDNLVLLLDTEDPRVVRCVDRFFRATCAMFGIVLKESAHVCGCTVDWLGVVLTAGQRHAVFRPKILQRIAECAAIIAADTPLPVRVWWRIAAIAIHASWIRERPLGVMVDMLRWISRLAGELQTRRVDWETLVRPWSGAVDQMASMLRVAPCPFVIRVVAPGTVAWGTSDAACPEYGGGFRAVVVRWRDGVVAAVRGQRTTLHINVEEFLAGEEGLRLAMERATAEDKQWHGWYDWKVDNTVALSWLSRTWLPEWPLNEKLVECRRRLQLAESDVCVTHIPGVLNRAADMLTRCVVCLGRRCECRDMNVRLVWRVVCACQGICEHITGQLQDRLAEHFRVPRERFDPRDDD